jgi:hypothetical protein
MSARKEDESGMAERQIHVAATNDGNIDEPETLEERVELSCCTIPRGLS